MLGYPWIHSVLEAYPEPDKEHQIDKLESGEEAAYRGSQENELPPQQRAENQQIKCRSGYLMWKFRQEYRLSALH